MNGPDDNPKARGNPSRRRRWAWCCNLIVPGSGLILLRREWLGLALAVLFALAVQGLLLGLLILPASTPTWLITVCAVAAFGVWTGAQWRLHVRLRLIGQPGVGRELARLRESASEAIRKGDYAEAMAILSVALTIDDEDVTLLAEWAQLMVLMGRFSPARRAWRRVAHLDRNGERHRQAVEALAALPVG